MGRKNLKTSIIVLGSIAALALWSSNILASTASDKDAGISWEVTLIKDSVPRSYLVIQSRDGEEIDRTEVPAKNKREAVKIVKKEEKEKHDDAWDKSDAESGDES